MGMGCGSWFLCGSIFFSLKAFKILLGLGDVLISR